MSKYTFAPKDELPATFRLMPNTGEKFVYHGETFIIEVSLPPGSRATDLSYIWLTTLRALANWPKA